ncbi:hypothetical protein HK102_012374, partial [Quaeritorhiza haematococci]
MTDNYKHQVELCNRHNALCDEKEELNHQLVGARARLSDLQRQLRLAGEAHAAGEWVADVVAKANTCAETWRGYNPDDLAFSNNNVKTRFADALRAIRGLPDILAVEETRREELLDEVNGVQAAIHQQEAHERTLLVKIAVANTSLNAVNREL